MTQTTLHSPARSLARRGSIVTGLVVGALGIAVLWASGVEFPVAVPPGLVILLVGAVVVAAVHQRWTAGLGCLLGLFVLVGFVVSGTGFENLAGDRGTAVLLGQLIEVLGVLLAAVSGALVAARPTS